MGRWLDVELGDLVLTGDRLTLRPWRAEDASAVCAALQDRVLHEFLRLPDPYTAGDAVEWVTALSAAGRRAGTGLACALIETATGSLAGSADLRLPDRDGYGAEIGYAVYANGRGHGYATEACRVLASWAFEHGVRRVQIRCAVANIASVKTASNAGFWFEGISRAGVSGPDLGVDAAVFARLSSDADASLLPSFTPLPENFGDGTITLRAVHPADAAALFDEENDAESRRWSFSGAEATWADVAAGAARAQLDWLVGTQARMAIVDQVTGEVAGTLTVRNVGPPGVGGLGYGLRPSWRGRGYTSRALRLVRRWAFTLAQFNRLELGAKTDNIASQRAARSGGFLDDGTRIGRLRNPDGTYSNEVRFAAFSPE